MAHGRVVGLQAVRLEDGEETGRIALDPVGDQMSRASASGASSRCSLPPQSVACGSAGWVCLVLPGDLCADMETCKWALRR